MPPTPPTAPDAEMMARYAAGTELPGAALLIASHLTYAPRARAALADCDRLGAALLAEGAAAPLAPGALQRALAALDGAEPDTPTPAPGPLPRPLARAVGIDFGDIPWRLRLPGVAEYDLAGYAPERVSLLRARPGSWLPRHTHTGRELTLVLAGALEDGGRVCHPGDIAQNTETDDHKPRIVGTQVCYCLIVLGGGLRYTGTFSRALNYLGD